MSRMVEVDLDLLTKIREQEGMDVYIRIFQDGSGNVKNARHDSVKDSDFGPSDPPNEAMQKAIKPTLLEDLETVSKASWPGDDDKAREAYNRLAKHLS